MPPLEATHSDQARTGVLGLDDVLRGGLTRNRVYLVEGTPGAGKTTLATQFLLDGAALGERGVYITLSETEEELRVSARSHGWEFADPVQIFELLPPEALLDEEQQQSLLYSSDLELGETTRRIFQAIEEYKPERVVLDSLSEIRLLAQSSLRYRRQILALKHYLSKADVTVLMLDDLTSDDTDKTVHSIAHGVIRLEELAPDFGGERRRLRILKYRGQKYRGGYHDFIIATGGIQVFPRLVSSEHQSDFQRDVVHSQSRELDSLLGGGIDRGSSTLILGPAGTGKSLLAMNYVTAAIARGEKAAMFIFDEELGLLVDRAKKLNVDLRGLANSGKLILEQVDAAELSPGEFTQRVRNSVEKEGVQTVVVDSLNGYQQAMPEERQLTLHMRELLQFLNRKGVSTFLTVAQHGIVGDMSTPVDVTYLADTVILLRYFEAAGRVRRAVSVIKKRMGIHENTIREYRIDKAGLEVGQPLTGFQGVLRGVPELIGNGNMETTWTQAQAAEPA